MNELGNYISTYFGIEKNDIDRVQLLFKEHQLKKGAFYTQLEHRCDKLSFVRSGLLRVYTFDGDKEITQWITTPGYFITDLSSLVFQKPSRWNIQALTDCELYTIHGEDYRNIRQMITNWDHLEKLFIAKCFLTLEDRVFSFLSKSAEERYQYFFINNKELFNQIPLQYIASMLGMTPETFSRIRRKLSS